MRPHFVRTLLSTVCIGGMPWAAHSAGFSLLEQSGSSMGHAVAGSAASAEDASTIYFNPAGMSKVQGMSAVATVHAVNVKAEFSGSGSNTAVVPVGGQGGNAGELAVIPNLYFSTPLGDAVTVGLGVNVPFGLTTEYDDDWIGRFQGIKSELTTVNVNPSIAYKVNDRVALGFGLNYQRAEVELTNAVGLAPTVEGRTRLKADDDAFGWNVGALFDVSQDMRIGVSYRSGFKYNLEGDVVVTRLSTGATVQTFNANAEAKFPAITTLSILQNYGEKWDLLGDVMYTRWSVLKQVNVIRANDGVVVDTLNFDFKDAWRLALGLNYRHNEQWTFKGGVAWDESPVEDSTRTVRLPDSDRIWLSVGAKFKFSRSGSLDVAYAHLFSADASINQTRNSRFALTGAPFSSNITGDYDSAIDILSINLAFTF